MKTSFICTVLNEEKTIEKLINSLLKQTKKIDEIIIVDGGSTDKTVDILKKNKQIRVFIKKGNRSSGRNYAIEKSSNEIILLSDAGCVLDSNWVKNIILPFKNAKAKVVAGYYKGKATNIFQKCIIPYALVMPGKIDKNNFLPASRSMAFKKSIWRKIGKFPQKYSYNEDYVFAKKLKHSKISIIFTQHAIAYWIPRNNIFETFSMFYKFAMGDAEAGIIRGKVVLLLLRYVFGVVMYLYLLKHHIHLIYIVFLLFLYCLWAICKNYQYVKHIKALYILPFIQFTADFSVMLGTFIGIVRKTFRMV